MSRSDKKSKYKGSENLIMAVFLDYENPEKAINSLDRKEHFNYEYADRYIRSLGEVKLMKAYAPFEYYKIAGENLKKYGFELINTPKSNKNFIKNDKTDPKMIVDMITIYFLHPEINLYIIISGDIHFLKPLLVIKEKPENRVYVISEHYSLNKIYYQYSDKVIKYHELKKLYI